LLAPPDDSTLSETVSFRLSLPQRSRVCLIAVYLTGATLFLSLMLSRVFYIILDFIHVQEDYTTLQAKTAKASGTAGETNELRMRIKELEAELGKSKSSDRDFGESSLPAVLRQSWHLIQC
jgi:hypothetical protein